MFALIPELVNDDAHLLRRGRFVNTTLLIEDDDNQHLVTVERGRVTVTPGPLLSPRWQFALRAATQDWERFFQEVPPPGWHDLMAMIKFKTLTAEGDLYPFMSNLLWFKDVLAAPRRLATRTKEDAS